LLLKGRNIGRLKIQGGDQAESGGEEKFERGEEFKR